MNNALNEKSTDVSDLMTADDGQYYVMETIGEEAIMKFKVPENAINGQQTFYLHSKGHYEFIIDPKGTPNIGYLKTFEQPGRFIEFSKQQYLEIKKHLGN